MQKIAYIFNASRFRSIAKKYCSTSAIESSDVTPLTHCINLVRKLDHDNFLTSLLLPHQLRVFAFAVRAFNVELSKIQEKTSSKSGGLDNIKFWENSLDAIYADKPPDHPVLFEVNKATKKYNLSKIFFKRLILPRLKLLNMPIFKDMTDMENYADNTCSSVLMLLLEAMNIRDINADHVASHVGKAQGLTNLIRSLPYNIRERVVLLPRAELVKHGVSEESLLRNTVDPQALSDIIFEIASKANSHLKMAESLKGRTPPSCRTVFLPAVPVRVYLQKLEKAKFYIYAPELTQKNGIIPYLLIWKRIRKSF